MKQLIILLAGLLAVTSPVQAKMILASRGKARVSIYTQPGAAPAEQLAAKELAAALKEITGATFEVLEAPPKLPKKAILIGPGPCAQSLFPDIPFDQLGSEELVVRTARNRLLLAGGRPRGTLYAVYRFLHSEGGVRWWAPWASTIPPRRQLSLKPLDLREKPAFESRDPFWYPAFDGLWALRNFSNSQSARTPNDIGGKIAYRGFVHTFYPLVPPESHFKEHPEWYSLLNGKRTSDRAQLCLSNPELRRFVAQRVKDWLHESPEARIISVSQNDWHGACQCAECKAIDDAEGSPAGSLLSLVNYVAEQIEVEFPQVAIDTLAYQYTRKAPKNIRPRPNVIVRLCSIECNFGEPLEAPVNAAFAKDIRDWAAICQRLYIWDYTTDFAHYVQPHPNWYSLGPNVRFFHEHNVKGLFEQGAYQSHGAEMAELRAWLLAQLMWNPHQDDRALMKEFLAGYYGAAAPAIGQYLELLYQASRGWNLTCYSSSEAPFLKFKTLAEAESLWQKAEQAVRPDPTLSWRVRISRLPLRYVWLSQWTKLREECRKANATWPLSMSRKAVAEEWLAWASAAGPSGWAKITHLNESGLSPETFLARFANDPPEK